MASVENYMVRNFTTKFFSLLSFDVLFSSNIVSEKAIQGCCTIYLHCLLLLDN